MINKKALIIITSSLIISLVYYYNTRAETFESGPQTVLLKNIQQTIKYKTEETPKVYLSQESEEIFKREIPKLYISNEELKSLLLNTEINNLESIVKKIRDKKNNLKYNFKKETQWDLNKVPKNDHDFHLAIDESQILILAKISKSIESKNLNDIPLLIASYYKVELIRAFEFKGYDKEDHAILDLTKTSKYADFKKKINKLSSNNRMPSSGENNLYKLNSSKFNDIENEAIKSGRGKQTPYFEITLGREARQKDYVKGDYIFGVFTSILDYAIGVFTKFSFVKADAEGLHKSNSILKDDIIKKAKKNPKLYGVRLDTAENGKYIQLTDIDLSIYLKAISHQEALWASKIGGVGAAITGIIGASFGKIISNSRLFALSLAHNVGIEVFIAALATYQGFKRMYVFHRYYSYRNGARIVSEVIEKKHSNARVDNIAFDANLIKFDHNFNRELRKIWAAGLAFGFIVKSILHRGNVMTSLQKMSAKSLNKVLIPGYSGLFAKIMNAVSVDELFKFIRPKTNFINSKLLNNKKIGWLKKWITKMSPAGLLVTAADVVVTGLSIYAGTSGVLWYGSKVLNNVQPSPGMNIQLALASREKVNANFHQASQEVFYPLCAYLALQSKYTEETQKSNYRINRQKSCLYLISKLEGVNVNEVEELFPNIYTMLINKTKPVLSKNYKKEYKILINEAFKYPDEYKVVWLTGLRSILPLDYISELYWEMRTDIVYGQGSFESEFWTYANPNTWINYNRPATFMNIDRMNHTTELLSIELFKNKYKKRHGKLPKDKVIISNTDDLTKAFITYFKYHRKSIHESIENYKKYSTQFKEFQSLNSTNSIADSIAEMGFLINKMIITEEYEDTSEFTIREEVSFLVNPSKEPEEIKEIAKDYFEAK